MKKAVALVLFVSLISLASAGAVHAECKQKDPAFTYVEELDGMKGCWITHDEKGEPLKKPIKTSEPVFMHKILVDEIKNGIIGSLDL